VSTEEDSETSQEQFQAESSYSNPDLRLAPEYAEIEEAYRKIKSFEEAVDILEDSETSYHQSARAVGNIWPEAYEAFVNMEEALDNVPDKFEAELEMNAEFEDFDEVDGEVNTRYRELKNAVKDAREVYNRASARLSDEIKSALLRGQDTPLDYAESFSDSEAFDERADRLHENFFDPEAGGRQVLEMVYQQH
jgi:hypothetical protein